MVKREHSELQHVHPKAYIVLKSELCYCAFFGSKTLSHICHKHLQHKAVSSAFFNSMLPLHHLGFCTRSTENMVEWFLMQIHIWSDLAITFRAMELFSYSVLLQCQNLFFYLLNLKLDWQWVSFTKQKTKETYSLHLVSCHHSENSGLPLQATNSPDVLLYANFGLCTCMCMCWPDVCPTSLDLLLLLQKPSLGSRTVWHLKPDFCSTVFYMPSLSGW